ncbi:MAG: hypothetical protein CL934_03335 [Deltaproteobacteria bacterium]|nr:hypothetical protein [Deltaproteobacteria bacterium]
MQKEQFKCISFPFDEENGIKYSQNFLAKYAKKPIICLCEDERLTNLHEYQRLVDYNELNRNNQFFKISHSQSNLFVREET